MFSMYIVWYLFLAGVGSGAYTLAAIFSIIGRYTSRDDLREYRIISRGGFWLGPLLVAFGAVFLVFDLGSPEKAFTIFLSTKFTILGFGAWAILLFCLLAAASIFLHTTKQVYVAQLLLRILEILTLLAALSVMIYTGILISSTPSVPFLYTPLIVVLFVISPLASGAALITLYGFFNQHRKSMRYGLRLIPRIDLVLIVLEVLALAALLVVKYFESEACREAANSMLIGENSLVFWFGVVLLGVVVPISMSIISSKSPQPLSAATWAVSATSVLVSALALRYCLITVGLHISVQLYL